MKPTALKIPWANMPFLLLYKWNNTYSISEFSSHKNLQQFVRRQDKDMFSEVYRFFLENKVYVPYTTIFSKVLPLYTIQQVCDNYSDISKIIERNYPRFAVVSNPDVS